MGGLGPSGSGQLRWWCWLCLSSAVLAGIASAALGRDAIGGPGEPTLEGELASPGHGPNVSVISDVPSYLWYHGCGPTSAGMIIGYWDAHGFGNLIPGSNDWSSNQQAVKDMIASPGHVRDYVPTPDRIPTLEDPYHADDCVADFCLCSRDPLEYGWSGYRAQDEGLAGYAEYCGYVGSTARNVSLNYLWDELVVAIDAAEPCQFLVDTDGNGGTDHFITVIGYDSTPGDRKYACYNTWDHGVHWFAYQHIGIDRPWGIFGGTFFQPVPEPAMLMPLTLLLGLLRRRRSC